MRQIIACLWIIPLSLLSLLSVFRAPVYALWKPAVGVIEWFHVVAFVLALGCLWPNPKARSSWLLWGLAVIALGLLLSPWFRAKAAAPSIAKSVEKAFGSQGLSNASLPGQATPLSLSRLFGSVGPAVPYQTHQINVAPGHVLPLDLYRAADATAVQPLVVVIHGGAWAAGDRKQLPAINHYLGNRGFTVASISYRLAPIHPHPAQINDVTAMITWLQKNAAKLRIEPNNITLLGRSAGGHLALLAAYRRVVPGIRGVIALYAVTDLRWSWKHPANPWIIDTFASIGDLIGGTMEQKPKAFAEASPLHHIGPTSPPTLLIHGGRDELVSPRQSERAAERLKQHGVLHAAVQMPWASHGCEANLFGPSGQLSLFAIERFLRYTQAHPPPREGPKKPAGPSPPRKVTDK